MRSETATEKPLCLYCLRPFEASPIRRIIEKDPLLCDECLSQIEYCEKIRKIDGINTLFLFKYKGLMKEALIQYKERMDVALSPLFLHFHQPILKLLFRTRLFVPVPSTAENMNRRGFSPLGEILENTASHFENILSLEGGIQKQNGIVDRHRKRHVSLLRKRSEISTDRIVLFDDVLTTGETFRQCVACLRQAGFLDIVGLILLDNHFDREIGLNL